MNFTIAVHGSPYGSFSHQHALAFCQSCVRAGHVIERIFFYHEAVYVALESAIPPQDEGAHRRQWIEFSKDHGTELCVCIANALKRGVIDEAEALRYEKSSGTMDQQFSIVGLGQLVDAMIRSDRYIEFPA